MSAMTELAFNDADHIFRSEKFQSVIADAYAFFTQSPVHPLPPTNRFIGPGVYGLYYLGDFPPYARLGEMNRKVMNRPIYVGKAVPAGWRTGRVAEREKADLHNRLKEHAESVEFANNLNLADFRCRFMILRGSEADLIGMAEAALIRRLSPLWNTTVSGFGLHDVGVKRYSQLKNQWDTLHPGREWASRMTGMAPEINRIHEAIQRWYEAVEKSWVTP